MGILAIKFLLLFVNQFLNRICKSPGIPLESSSSSYVCSHCLHGKMSKLPFILSRHVSVKPLELVHSDLLGPAPAISLHGYIYYISFIDDMSRYTWIFPLLNKSYARSVITKFMPYVANLLDNRVKIFRSDRGGEFVNRSLSSFFDAWGLSHQKSCPYTPEQNDVAERKHLHIVQTALSLISKSSVRLKFWYYAFSTTVFLTNRMTYLQVDNVP